MEGKFNFKVLKFQAFLHRRKNALQYLLAKPLNILFTTILFRCLPQKPNNFGDTFFIHLASFE